MEKACLLKNRATHTGPRFTSRPSAKQKNFASCEVLTCFIGGVKGCMGIMEE